jgi:hypothetical protein
VGWIDFLCFEMWYIVPTVLLITTLTGKSLGRPETSNVVELELAYIESPSSASRLYTGLPTTERPEGLGRDSGRIGEHREYGAVSAGKGKTLDLETQRNMSTEEAISLYGLNR